ncbi:hypothetical protein FQN54_004878 [Arachnomyces sp. PD_36]|nr:hypothetical protein FQN54_004878 [Arachnomyces sp. PD_36]
MSSCQNDFNTSQTSTEEGNELLSVTGTDPPQVKEPQGLHRHTPDRNLRYRKRALWLLLLYLPLLVLPWVFTCVMMFRPMMKRSYINQIGEYSLADIYRMQHWHNAVNILDGIASVLAIPVVSALLAHGAVIYAQRRKPDQDLNIRQMFVLADQGWASIPVLWLALSKPSQKRSSPYLWFGAFLLFFTTIHPPLRQLLVQDEAKTVITCNDQAVAINNDDSTCYNGLTTKVVGYDPEPQVLALSRQNTVIQRTLNKIIDATPSEVQPNLWREVDEESNFPAQDQTMNTLLFYYSFDIKEDGSYFASSLRNGTTTGVLREHAIRMDTNVQCDLVDNFPDHCTGDKPFTTNFTTPVLDASICVEGSYDRVPWNNTRDQQNITEQLWMHMNVNPDALDVYAMDLRDAKNFTMCCTAESRRGWFELGNYQNNYSHQPMVETWPSLEVMKNEFNDISSRLENIYWPVKEEPPATLDPFDTGRTMDPFWTEDLKTPGPLMTAALALFGNGTLMQTAIDAPMDQQRQAAADICEHSRVPFMRYMPREAFPYQELMSRCSNLHSVGEDYVPLLLSEIVGLFMQLLSNPINARQFLEITAFFANEALLLSTVDAFGATKLRAIYTSPGYTILKPQISIPGLVVISLLIGLQVVTLLVLVLFIYSAPSWVESLDALTLARIGAQLSSQGKGLDSASVSAVVGVREHEEVRQPEGIRKRVKILALGEPGVISRSSRPEEF